MVWTLPILFIAGCVLLSVPLGRYMAWALGDSAHPVLRGLDRATGLACGRRGMGEQSWRQYAVSLVVFNIVLFTVAYLVLTLQHHLPLNPDAKGGMAPDLAFNTAASFTTNTNLQHYSGEQHLSYFSQLVAIMWPQFVSAATGIAAMAAICRALSGRATVGSFLKDISRVAFLVLLPASVLVGLGLIACGVPMTLQGAATVTTLEGAEQAISRGPVAAIVAIKQLGTNGGGYFGPNSTHPFENPTLVSNLIECTCIMVIPMACVWMFGRMVGSTRQAAVVFASMLVLYVGFTALAVWLEQAPAASLAGLPVQESMNLEGKELRFGESAGPLWAVTTVGSPGTELEFAL